MKMRKTKLMVTMIVGALVFACVLSCDDEQESVRKRETLSMKGEASNRTAVNRSSNNSSTINFDGSEGGPLDLATAKKWTANFRETMTGADEIQAHYFGFEIIKQILDQPGCVGIRIYYAFDDEGEKKLLLVGVDSKGENLMPSENGKTTDEGNIVGDFSFPCPNTCPGTGL